MPSDISYPYRERAQLIAQDLRDRIAASEFKQGERLPTRRTLATQYGVTSATLQRALAELLAEGFVEAEGRRGTFVCENPPHLTNYALLFPSRFLADGPTNGFYQAMYRAAQEIGGNRRMQIFDGFSNRAGFERYESLVEDVARNRLAGLIFASAPFAAHSTPLMADDGMPRTAVMSHHAFPHVPAVATDFAAFAEMTASRFAAAGRRRIAALVNSSLNDANIDCLRAALHRHGLILDDDQLLGLSIQRPRWAYTAARLLFDRPAADRPDGLLIADDNLVEHVGHGLASLGISMPDDLMAVGYCNFPWPTPSVVPIDRVGFSATDILEACISNIDQARLGQRPPDLTRIEPMYQAYDSTLTTRHI